MFDCLDGSIQLLGIYRSTEVPKVSKDDIMTSLSIMTDEVDQGSGIWISNIKKETVGFIGFMMNVYINILLSPVHCEALN